MQKVAARSNGHYPSTIIPTEPSPEQAYPEVSSFNVLTYQRRILPILLAWATGSIAAGWLWWRSEDTFWRGMGSQFLGWGIIDGLLAGAGLRGATRNNAKFLGELPVTQNKRQTKRLEKIFWVSSGLDILYMIGGKWLMDHPTQESGKLDRRGMGLGIILQSVFLLLFDLLNALFINSKRD